MKDFDKRNPVIGSFIPVLTLGECLYLSMKTLRQIHRTCYSFTFVYANTCSDYIRQGIKLNVTKTVELIQQQRKDLEVASETEELLLWLLLLFL